MGIPFPSPSVPDLYRSFFCQRPAEIIRTNYGLANSLETFDAGVRVRVYYTNLTFEKIDGEVRTFVCLRYEKLTSRLVFRPVRRKPGAQALSSQ